MNDPLAYIQHTITIWLQW